MKKQDPFIETVEEIRRKARQHMDAGAVTSTYPEDHLENAIRLLNTALATEMVCVLRYKNHYYMARGLEAQEVADEFLEHANEEQDHVERLSTRIVQLGGNPELDPGRMLGKSYTEYTEERDLKSMLEANLIAERIAIDTYREMIAYFAPFDPTTRRVLEKILADEEEHAEELSTLLGIGGPKPTAKPTDEEKVKAA